MESFKPVLEKIKRIKNEKGYTNEMLAKKAGIPLSTLNKILSSVIKDPKIGTIIAITDALNIDINSLIYPKIENSNETAKTTDSLNYLAEDYKLNFDDISFIQRYINLSTENRHKFLSLLKILANDDKSSRIPQLKKPDHILSVEEKRRIVEYELSLEEKKQYR